VSSSRSWRSVLSLSVLFEHTHETVAERPAQSATLSALVTGADTVLYN
jgi:hypothetical protein